MIDELRKMVLEKTGSEEETREFMKGFIEEVMEKTAWTKNKPTSFGEQVREGFGKSLGGGLGGLAVNTGVLIAGKLIGSTMDLHLKAKFMDSLKRARSMNKVIQGADPNKVTQFAETIYAFAPHVASDPNLLSTILANAIHGDGLDPMTIKTLTELEGKYMDNFSFSPKSIL